MFFFLDNQLLASSVGTFAPPHTCFQHLMPSKREKHWSFECYILCLGQKCNVQEQYLKAYCIYLITLVALNTISVDSQNALICHFCHCTEITFQLCVNEQELLPFIIKQSVIASQSREIKQTRFILVQFANWTNFKQC